jgi:hypothetical protein
MGNPADAIDYLEDGLMIGRAIGDTRVITLCLDNLGYAYFDLGDITQAWACAREGLATGSTIKTMTLILDILALVVKLYMSCEQWEQAAALLRLIQYHPAADYWLRKTVDELKAALPEPLPQAQTVSWETTVEALIQKESLC